MKTFLIWKGLPTNQKPPNNNNKLVVRKYQNICKKNLEKLINVLVHTHVGCKIKLFCKGECISTDKKYVFIGKIQIKL